VPQDHVSADADVPDGGTHHDTRPLVVKVLVSDPTLFMASQSFRSSALNRT
jgi:hypothetical protein